MLIYFANRANNDCHTLNLRVNDGTHYVILLINIYVPNISKLLPNWNLYIVAWESFVYVSENVPWYPRLSRNLSGKL